MGVVSLRYFEFISLVFSAPIQIKNRGWSYKGCLSFIHYYKSGVQFTSLNHYGIFKMK
jgi:hypothetical protein